MQENNTQNSSKGGIPDSVKNGLVIATFIVIGVAAGLIFGPLMYGDILAGPVITGAGLGASVAAGAISWAEYRNSRRNRNSGDSNGIELGVKSSQGQDPNNENNQTIGATTNLSNLSTATTNQNNQGKHRLSTQSNSYTKKF